MIGKAAKEFLVISSAVLTTTCGLNLAICAPDVPLEVVEQNTTQRSVQVTEESSNIVTQTEQENTAASVADVSAVESVPVYMYVKDGMATTYDATIQAEIYRQWSEFDGILPDYEMVLGLWISESGLNPYATNYNDDGTVDIGIPQLNTTTIQEAYAQGWMSYEEDIYNLDTQIHVGLCVLSYYCEACPGGDYPYYRAIRAYGMGIGGLEYAESIGDYGQNDLWSQGANNMWYPGKYGVIMETASHLVPDPDYT